MKAEDFTIIGFKIVGKEVEIKVLTKEPDGTRGSDNPKRKSPIHKDLQARLDKLRKHFAVMSGCISAKVATKAVGLDEVLATFHVHGFATGGGDDKDEGVVIMGHRTIEGGFAVGMNSPFRRFEEKPETRYQFMDELQQDLKDMDAEVRAYLDGTKRGVEPQQELGFPEGEDKGGKKEVVNKAQILPDESLSGRKDMGGKTEKKVHIPQVDAEAQKRVAEIDKEKIRKSKRVAQSADNKSGVVEEGTAEQQPESPNE